jgi:hypothetical protein
VWYLAISCWSHVYCSSLLLTFCCRGIYTCVSVGTTAACCVLRYLVACT